MNIGFDGKRLYHNETGLGSYSRSVLKRMLQFYPNENYKIFVHHKYYTTSPFKHTDLVDKTVVASHSSPKAWRLKYIQDELIEHQIQIYHGLSNELPINLPNQIKKVVTIHDVIHSKLPKSFSVFDRMIYKKKTKKAIQDADCIIAVSQQTKNDLIEYFQASEHKIKIVYPTWNREFDYPITYNIKDEYWNKIHIPRDFILYVGAISKRKNFISILKALLVPENKDKNLVAVTQGGDEYKKVEKFIYENNLQDRIYFLHNIPNYELPIIYHMSQGLVYPSLYEGFGLPILEALCCGKPVITSKVSSMPEVGGDACIFIDPNNIEELANAIQFIYYNLEYKEEIEQKAKLQVQQFAPDIMVKQLMDIYQTV